MTDPNKNLSVDLATIPKDWWLYGLFHNHIGIIFTGDVHRECSVELDGCQPWSAKLQHIKGGRLTEGRGDTPGEALKAAILEVELRNPT